jgi:hypothetical protein
MRGMGLGGNGPNPGGQNNRVDRRYSITLSASAHNIFNVVNLAPPNATLGGTGQHHRFSLFRRGYSVGDRLFLPRLRGAGFQLSGDLQLLGGFGKMSSTFKRICHPDRSEAEWRDLLFLVRFSHRLVILAERLTD